MVRISGKVSPSRHPGVPGFILGRMRMVAVLGSVLLTAGCVLAPSTTPPPPAVIVTPATVGPPASIALTAEAGFGNAYGHVFLTARVTDAAGHGVPGAVLVFSSTLGTLFPAVVTADGFGQAQNRLETSGPATVTAATGTISRGIRVTPLLAPPPEAPIVLNPNPLPDPPPPPPPSVAPPPPPAFVPSPPSLRANLSCTIAIVNEATRCNVASAYYGDTLIPSSAITGVTWDWGDGTVTGGSAPAGLLGERRYTQAGTYTVRATVTAPTVDGVKVTTTSQALVIRTTVTATPTPTPTT